MTSSTRPVDARVAVTLIATFKQSQGSVDRGIPITVTNSNDTNAAWPMNQGEQAFFLLRV